VVESKIDFQWQDPKDRNKVCFFVKNGF